MRHDNQIKSLTTKYVMVLDSDEYDITSIVNVGSKNREMHLIVELRG
jgi:hypothetical protein